MFSAGNPLIVRCVKQFTGVTFCVCYSTITCSHSQSPTAAGLCAMNRSVFTPWLDAHSPLLIIHRAARLPLTSAVMIAAHRYTNSSIGLPSLRIGVGLPLKSLKCKSSGTPR